MSCGRKLLPRRASRRRRKSDPRTESSTGATTTCHGGGTRQVIATSGRSAQGMRRMQAVTPLPHKLPRPPSSTPVGLPSSPTCNATWPTNDSSPRHGSGLSLPPVSWPDLSTLVNSRRLTFFSFQFSSLGSFQSYILPPPRCSAYAGFGSVSGSASTAIPSSTARRRASQDRRNSILQSIICLALTYSWLLLCPFSRLVVVLSPSFPTGCASVVPLLASP